MKKILSHPLFSGSAIMIGGSMIVNVVSYLYHIIMGRILGPADYGTLTALFALLYIVSVVPASTSIAITKFISSAKNKAEISYTFHAIQSFVGKVAIFVSILTLLLSPIVKDFLHVDNIFLVVLVVPVLYLSLVTLVNQATSQGLLKFIGLIGPNIVSVLGKLIFGVALVYLGYSVLGAMIAVVLGAILSYLYSIVIIKDLSNEAKSSNKKNFNLRKFIKYVIPSLLQALAFTFYFTIDILLVKHFLPEFDAGLYAAISTLGKIIYFAVTPIAQTMFPIVATRISKGEEYKKVFLVALLSTIGLSAAIVGFYYFLPNIAIGVLYGSKYLVASEALAWMGIYMAIYSISNFLMNYLLSIGKTGASYWALLIVPLQIMLIVNNHSDITTVVQMNLISMIILFLGLSGFLIYNREK